MKIKKNIFHVIFFNFFFSLINIILTTVGFFLGFEVTKRNILIYFLIIAGIILLGFIICCFYSLFCKTYYEFTKDSLKITRKGNIIKEINYNKIKHCEYCRFGTLLLGDSKGGKLIIYYLEDEIEKNIEVSFLKRLTKKININNIFIK